MQTKCWSSIKFERHNFNMQKNEPDGVSEVLYETSDQLISVYYFTEPPAIPSVRVTPTTVYLSNLYRVKICTHSFAGVLQVHSSFSCCVPWMVEEA
jgi:hypothetical protein